MSAGVARPVSHSGASVRPITCHPPGDSRGYTPQYSAASATAPAGTRARDVARRYGERFPHDPRGAELFNRVNHLEASQRREQAKEQGIVTLEQFIAQGRKHEAELALKLLRGMSIEPARLAALEEKVKVLG